MLEEHIESKLRKKVKAAGGLAWKFVSPGLRGVPDRLCLYPIEAGHEEIVARYVRFVETKAPKKSAARHQLRRHKDLRDRGFYVEVLDTI